jgi:hypothetical protein
MTQEEYNQISEALYNLRDTIEMAFERLDKSLEEFKEKE